jgi:outer membrane receptor protein involved in Fe transport
MKMSMSGLRLSLAVLLMFGSVSAFAQTTSIVGTVVDTAGAVVPGASVVAKNPKTGTSFEATTSGAGTFTIPSVPTGTYTVTVSLSGFKTFVLTDVVANVGGPASVKASLAVGGQEETITVEAKSELIQTQASAVSTTVDARQIVNLPLTSRAVLDFVTLLPGVNTPGGNRNSMVNGLPQSQINITLDGINVQDNTLKGDAGSDGFFAIVSPRMDSVEEVTVSMAGIGAESSGQGGVQIQFVTRSGTNSLKGSLYHYLRKDKFNENTFFNEQNNVAKAKLKQNQLGLAVGGPIRIPGVFDGRNKAFFFVNWEELRQPQDVTRQRTILSSASQQGSFTYLVAGQPRTVNLLQLAAANGQTATTDPLMAKLLSDIRASTGTTGTVTDLPDPHLQRFTYNVPVKTARTYPTVRLDWDITPKHRATLTTNYQDFSDSPDTLNNQEAQFPGFPAFGGQGSERVGISGSFRSNLGANLVNELRIGGSGAPVKFFAEQNIGMFKGTSVGDQGGFRLNLNQTNLAITNASAAPAPQARNAKTRLIENKVNWLKGAHSLSFGGSFTQLEYWQDVSSLVPQVNFGIGTGDPADAMFNITNFPGASTTNLNVAKQLYATLTGRITSITGNAGLDAATGTYKYLGVRSTTGKLADIGFFVQDNWRIRPNLSLNLGLRYEIQTPFESDNDVFSTATLASLWGVSGLAPGCESSNITPSTCNIFKPSAAQGPKPTFDQLKKGVKAYGQDLNNFAPSIGFNWSPSVSDGFWRKIVGEQGDTSIRGGFARSYSRAGMSDFTGPLGANPGVAITTDRSITIGNLGTLPLLLRETNRLGPPAFAEKPVYPLSDVSTGDVNAFDPNLKTPHSDSWSLGFQRALGKNMAAEVRYVGTRSRDLWRTYDINEVNIIENGYLNEFRLAQANLQANIAAGRGATFAFFGAGTGTSPLPIHLAYFNGVPAAQAGDASRYTSANFTSSTFVNPLARFNPQPRTAANALDSVAAQITNAINAGLPANFLVANPDLLGGALVTSNGGGTNYHSIQFELKRRFTNGFQMNGSYVYGRANELAFYSFRKPFMSRKDAGTEGGVVHAGKAYGSWELPIGKGRRFLGNANGVLDRILGGWQLHGSVRIQSGQLLDLGNVRMVGFDKKELQKMFEIRKVDNATAGAFPKQRVFILPQAIIDETVKAFSVSATSASGYGASGPPSGKYFAPANGPDCVETAAGDPGDCGTRTLVVSGPLFKTVDLSLTKEVRVAGRTKLGFRVEAINVFNRPNFAPVGGIGSTPGDYEVTGLNGQNTSRTVQLVSRFSW